MIPGLISALVEQLQPSAVAPTPNVSNTVALSVLLCCLSLIANVTVGIVYARLADRNSESLTGSDAALGGSTATIASVIVESIFSDISTLLLRQEALTKIHDILVQPPINLQPGNARMVILVDFVFTACVLIVVGGVVGAGAASLYATLTRSSATKRR